jgi:hypothetical protein
MIQPCATVQGLSNLWLWAFLLSTFPMLQASPALGSVVCGSTTSDSAKSIRLQNTGSRPLETESERYFLQLPHETEIVGRFAIKIFESKSKFGNDLVPVEIEGKILFRCPLGWALFCVTSVLLNQPIDSQIMVSRRRIVVLYLSR